MKKKELLQKYKCFLPYNRSGMDIMSKDFTKFIGHVMKKDMPKGNLYEVDDDFDYKITFNKNNK